jgi:rubrerythrin
MMNRGGPGCGYPDLKGNFMNDLIKSINGEYSAICCYERLAKHAPSSEERKRILEIRNDEIRHYEAFANIYLTLTGRKPEPEITETCPGEYRKGLAEAFKDEQETVDFYNEVADETLEPWIKDQFRRFAADEQNHAVWFSYFYFRTC